MYYYKGKMSLLSPMTQEEKDWTREQARKLMYLKGTKLKDGRKQHTKFYQAINRS